MTTHLRRATLAAAIAVSLCLALTGTAQLTAAQPDVPARYIVAFQDWFPNAASQARLVRGLGGETIRPLPIVNATSVAVPPGIARQLARRAEVRRVDVDAEVRALGKPAAPPGKTKPADEQPPQVLPWGVDRIDAEALWGTPATGAGAVVAVIDTGIDRDHPDLAANVIGGTNFVSKNWRQPPNPDAWDDDNGHGSHVAGIIAAPNNSVGVVGVAPEASLYAMKALNKAGSGYISDIIAAIDLAVDSDTLLGIHIDIINMSLGADVDVPSFEEACDAAAAAGLLLVAAAGNDGADVDYPGAYDSVIAVAATNAADGVPSWSSPGPEVAIAAPGVSVYSTWKDGGYDTIDGTSMAAPHVSGVLALMLAAGAGSNPCAGADSLAAPWTGCGLVDAEEAVTGAETGDN